MWIIEFMMMAIEDMKVIVREQAYLLYYYNRLHEAYIWLLPYRRRRYYIWRRSCKKFWLMWKMTRSIPA
jgi:hypothetical protein